MKRIWLLFLFFLGLSLIASSGCEKKEAKTVANEKVITVFAKPAEEKLFRPYINSTGTLIPYEVVTVSAELDGVVKEVRIDEGTPVTKGSVLVRIDDTDYSLEVKRAEAALKQAEASLANTAVEYKRRESLYKEGLSTKEEFDEVSTRKSLAEAEIEKAKVSLSLSKQKLSKTKIVSPLSGVARDKKVTAGDYVRNGSPLLKVIQIDPIKLNFTVPEKDIGRLKTGQEVQFKVDPFPDKEFKGKLSIIYSTLDEKSRTLQIEANVPNPTGLLIPGLFTQALLYTSAPKTTLVIPITAILYEAEHTTVFIVEKGKAVEKSIRLGVTYGDVMEVLEGLQKGDMVVVAGHQNLANGVRVNVAR